MSCVISSVVKGQTNVDKEGTKQNCNRVKLITKKIEQGSRRTALRCMQTMKQLSYLYAYLFQYFIENTLESIRGLVTCM